MRPMWASRAGLFRGDHALDPKTGEFGGLKFSLRKFRKTRGVYRMESKFNIGNPDQARSIADTLARWVSEASIDPGA